MSNDCRWQPTVSAAVATATAATATATATVIATAAAVTTATATAATATATATAIATAAAAVTTATAGAVEESQPTPTVGVCTFGRSVSQHVSDRFSSSSDELTESVTLFYERSPCFRTIIANRNGNVGWVWRTTAFEVMLRVRS